MKSDRKSGDTNNPRNDAKQPLAEKSDQTKRVTHTAERETITPKDYQDREKAVPNKDWEKENPKLKPSK